MAVSTEVVTSPLQQMAATTATDYWNDSSSVEELTYAVARGATGATSNPTIVGEVLKKELHLWRDRIPQLVAEHPTWTEDEVTWKLIEEISVRGSEILLPVFEREGGRKGRLSIQTNPTYYRDAARITEQALHFATLAPNMQVKVPATKAGIQAAEDLTAAGVNINATVSFTVPQVLAVAEAVERGLVRREADGGDTTQMTPVVTMMVGRLDDWIQVLVKRDGTLVDPGYPHWAGIACFKHAYAIYQERGYRARLLAAAYRHHLHWTELVGGDVVLTIPHAWQKLFNESGFEPVTRMDEPVSEPVVSTLYERFPDFRRAYDADGMIADEFDSYGATVRTLRTFVASYHELVATIRDVMLPDPDIVPA
jgi:transaldolase